LKNTIADNKRFTKPPIAKMPNWRYFFEILAKLGLDARAQGVNRSPMRLLASAFHSRDDCAPLFRAAARFVSWEGSSSSHDPFFSRAAAQRREDVDEVAARGVMGTRKLACCDG
jgi:hypothetical protein